MARSTKNILDDNIDPMEEDENLESLDLNRFLSPEDSLSLEEIDDIDDDEDDDLEITDYGILGEIDFEELEEIDELEMMYIEEELKIMDAEDKAKNKKLLKEMADKEKEILNASAATAAKAKKRRKQSDTVIIDSIRKYQKDVSKYELLTREEEVELARRWQNNGDQEAFQQLVVSNLRLVISIAQKYRNNGLDFNEIIQEGNIGLIRALERYDPEAGFRVSTYATWWIRQCIVRGLADKSRPIRLPVHVNEKVIKIKKVRNSLHKKLYRPPTPEEMLPFLEPMTLKEIKSILDAVKDISSMNINVGDDGNSTIADFIEDKAICDPAQEIDRKQLKEILHELINELPERERYIIERRFNLEGSKNQTLEEIGAVLGVTRERVRQLEVKGLKILREKMEERDIDCTDFQ